MCDVQSNHLTHIDALHCKIIRATMITGMRLFWENTNVTGRLQKSLPNNLFQNISVAMFCLGDRCYGPDKYCAAGRKLIIRLRQLGATLLVHPGYGDDNTPNGGIFTDLDQWLYTSLLPRLFPTTAINVDQNNIALEFNEAEKHSLYNVTIVSDDILEANSDRVCSSEMRNEEWQNERYQTAYREFFERQGPLKAYHYSVQDRQHNGPMQREMVRQSQCRRNGNDISMLLGRVVENRRLTATSWKQNTRHVRFDISLSTQSLCSDEIEIDVTKSSNNNNNSHETDGWSLEKLPYQAGDVTAIMPSNAVQEVSAFLNVLPKHLQQVADCELLIQFNNDNKDPTVLFSGIGYRYWPTKCTFRGLLTHCADIHAFPEREDLRALAQFCSYSFSGRQQHDKLLSLSETKDSALYVDYIIRERRCWVDVLYDFDSLREDGSKLTMEAILGLLLPIRPRLFSIASSPTKDWIERNENSPAKESFSVELCVAAVEGTTRRGRSFRGLCSNYLCNLIPANEEAPMPLVRLWIQPGSFHGLPLPVHATPTINIDENLNKSLHSTPVLCIGAGTGVAPLRAIILERVALTHLNNVNEPSSILKRHERPNPDVLLFGCRKTDADFYYASEWKALEESGQLQVLTAFSQDQRHKVYVQQVLESEKAGYLKIVQHLIDNKGAIYIAGNPKMARAVNDVIVEALCKFYNYGEKDARKTLSRIQGLGLYSVEAWS